MSIKKGFTLVELIIVITIIGLLATGVSAVYSSASAKSRDAVRIQDLDVLEMGISLYGSENGGIYPGLETTEDNGKGSSLLVLQGSYIKDLPRSPKPYSTSAYSIYRYTATDGLSRYELASNLESASNDLKEQNDGGERSEIYEIGDLLQLDGSHIVTANAGLPRDSDIIVIDHNGDLGIWRL